MQKIILIIIPILFSIHPANAQNKEEASAKIYAAHLEEVEIRDPQFERDYRFLKSKVILMYPYAQYCRELLYEFNKELLTTSKKRKQKKLGKETHNQLKEDFKYVVLNMTETEGRVLMKLIHKETGMSVYDIIEAYRGSAKANYWNVFSKIFDQDLKSTFDPKEDWIIETIYNKIVAGVYEVEEEVNIISKEEHKADKKASKKRVKENRKKVKEFKKKKKKLEKAKAKKGKS